MFKNKNLQSFGSTTQSQQAGLVEFLEEVNVSKYLKQQLSDEQIAEMAEAIGDWPSESVVRLWGLMAHEPLNREPLNSARLYMMAKEVLVNSVLGLR